jgi:3'(2'), 5'-bisphosphate nucleotidase
MTVPTTDGAFAGWLAARAGELLLGLRDELGFEDAAALKAAGDKRSHDLITAELARLRPDDAVLSEEGERGDTTRLTADRVWIVDPLDGTREFSEKGRGDWAVHIGLWTRGPALETAGPMAAGAVALPAQGLTLTTDQPPTRPVRRAGAAIRIAASRTRPPAFLTGLAEALGAELVPMGSAGAKIAAVIDGTVDAYVHAGGQHEWDSAAPVAVALAVGLHASRVDGSALRYNRPDPRLPDLLVCQPDLAGPILRELDRVG